MISYVQLFGGVLFRVIQLWLLDEVECEGEMLGFDLSDLVWLGLCYAVDMTASINRIDEKNFQDFTQRIYTAIKAKRNCNV